MPLRPWHLSKNTGLDVVNFMQNAILFSKVISCLSNLRPLTN